MVVIIEEIESSRNWKYLWLKYINSVNLKQHCARCLIGAFSRKINRNIKKEQNIWLNEYKGKYYYLCGVSEPYVWEENFHLAFKECEGETIEVNEKGLRVKIYNAQKIDFSEEDVDLTLKQARNPYFKTCRNWQFANKINNEKNEHQMKLI